VPDQGAVARSAIEQTLMAAIGAGQLEAGSVLSLPWLASRYGSTASDVRTAMRALGRDGLVELLPDDSFQVAEPGWAELREIRDLRITVEVHAVRTITEAGVTDAQLRVLRRLADVTATRAWAGDVVGYINADLELHLQLLALAEQTELIELVRVLRIRGRIQGVRHAPAAFMSINAEEHRELVRMVGDGESNAAADLLRRHIGRLDQTVATTTSPEGQPEQP
jgi:DNA-binding GntR family transcriptional regulator